MSKYSRSFFRSSIFAGMNRSEYLQDQDTIDAIVHNLDVPGDAARQIADAFATCYSDVPWRILKEGYRATQEA